MATTMHWENGFRRIRLVGTAAVVIGALLLLLVLMTQELGYAPDPAFTQLFGALWPLGLMLLVLGILLWLTNWVLMGFVTERTAEKEPPRAQFDR